MGITFQEIVLLKDASFVYLFLILSAVGCAAGFSKSIFFIRLRNYFLAAVFLFLGIIIHFYNSKKPIIPTLKKNESIVFKLDKKLNFNEKNKRYEVTILSDSLIVRSILSIPQEQKELDFKHFYKADALMSLVEHPKNDYQFDYAKYLSRKGIFHQGYVINQYESSIRSNLSIPEKIKQWRLTLLQKIDQVKISARSRELMKGIILADRTEMDRKTVADFSKTGLVHILAISGSHMVVIFGIFFLIFKNLFPVRHRKMVIIMSLVSIWLFAVFIDYGNPVVRSCIMLSVYFGYKLLERKADMLHSMALAAFLILVNSSYDLFDVGFQLSFIAVLGIYWLNQPILKKLPKTRKNFHLLAFSILSITISAQIATLPLVLYYFHQFSFISFAANLVIIPFSQILIIFSIIMTVIIGAEVQIPFLNNIYDWFIQKILDLIGWFAGFESLFSKNIPFSILELAILFVAAYFLRFLILKFQWKNLLPVAYTLALFFIARFSLNFYHDTKSETIVHSYFKERIFSAKEGKRVTFWMSENANPEKIQQYVIDPYLISRRSNVYTVKFFPKETAAINYKGKEYQLKDD